MARPGKEGRGDRHQPVPGDDRLVGRRVDLLVEAAHEASAVTVGLVAADDVARGDREVPRRRSETGPRNMPVGEPGARGRDAASPAGIVADEVRRAERHERADPAARVQAAALERLGRGEEAPDDPAGAVADEEDRRAAAGRVRGAARAGGEERPPDARRDRPQAPHGTEDPVRRVDRGDDDLSRAAIAHRRRHGSIPARRREEAAANQDHRGEAGRVDAAPAIDVDRIGGAHVGSSAAATVRDGAATPSAAAAAGRCRAPRPIASPTTSAATITMANV